MKCSRGKIINPKTGRCVKRSGKIGKEILKKKSKSVSKRRKSKVKSRQRRNSKRISSSSKRVNLNTLTKKQLIDKLTELFSKESTFAKSRIKKKITKYNMNELKKLIRYKRLRTTHINFYL